MFRAVALFAGMVTVLAPTVLAQNTLCVFQQKQGHAADVDAGFDATLLVKELSPRMPATLGLNVVTISGFTGKEIEAEAQRRNCAWVVTLWREQMGEASPNYEGTLGGTQAKQGPGSQSHGEGRETRRRYSARLLAAQGGQP